MSEGHTVKHGTPDGSGPFTEGQAADIYRHQILDAARVAFFERGYPETTLEELATRARMSPEMVEEVIGGTRGAVVALMDTLVRGSDSPLSILESPALQQMRRETDQRTQLQMLADDVSGVLDRVGPMYLALRHAAHSDGEVAVAYTSLHDAGRRNMGIVAEWIAANGPLKAGMSNDMAADVLWTLTSADVHHLLRFHREWSEAQYREWLTATLIASLLP